MAEPASCVSTSRTACPAPEPVGARARLTYCPAAPVTVNTAQCAPSFTVMLLTLTARSSLRRVPTGAVSLPMPLSPVNHWPVPSSLMVPTPVAEAPRVTPSAVLSASLV